MSAQPLKTGVIGLNVGLTHVQNYQKLPNAELVAVCDIDEPWLKHVQQTYGVAQAYTSVEAMLAQSEVEAVSVCLPVYLHRPVTLACLAAGKHVLVERATGLHSRNWFNEAAKGGGVGRDLGAHMIDLALWIMGFPAIADVSGRSYTNFGPDYVRQFGGQFRFDADDHTVGFVRFQNGASLQLEMSFGQHIDQEVVLNEFFGTKGGVRREAGQGLKLFGEAAGSYTTTTPRLPAATGSTQANFVDHIVHGTPLLVTPEQGIVSMQVIDGLYASSTSLRAG